MMPACAICGRAFATAEVTVEGHVLACEEHARLLEVVARLMGTQVKRRPVLGIVPSGSVE